MTEGKTCASLWRDHNWKATLHIMGCLTGMMLNGKIDPPSASIAHISKGHVDGQHGVVQLMASQHKEFRDQKHVPRLKARTPSGWAAFSRGYCSHEILCLSGLQRDHQFVLIKQKAFNSPHLILFINFRGKPYKNRPPKIIHQSQRV